MHIFQINGSVKSLCPGKLQIINSTTKLDAIIVCPSSYFKLVRAQQSGHIGESPFPSTLKTLLRHACCSSMSHFQIFAERLPIFEKHLNTVVEFCNGPVLCIIAKGI